MNKDEISKEIGDFLKFNASDIKGLIKLSPDLANAFSNVILAIDEKYGANLIPTQGITNLTTTIAQNRVSRFLPGDYLCNVNRINVPFKKFYQGTISDKEYMNGSNFSGFRDVLIITNIYDIDGVLYYSTTPSKDYNYYKDQIRVMDVDYESYLFEVSLIDDFYDDYFEKYGVTSYNIGSYILCPELTKKEQSDMFSTKPNLDYMRLDNTSEGMSIVELSNMQPLLDFTAKPVDLYKQTEVIFVKDIQQVDGKNYYIVHAIQQSLEYVFESSNFDSCFYPNCVSVKNNDVFKQMGSTNEVQRYYWFAKNEIDTNGTNLVLDWKAKVLTPTFDDRNTFPFSDSSLGIDGVYNSYFKINNFDNTQPLLPYESREVIAEYEKLHPIVEKIKTGNTVISNDTFIPAQSLPYVKTAKYNLVTSARKSPTESATSYSEGSLMIGCDGNLWVIAVDKNGTHRWVKNADVLKYLPDEVFNGQMRSNKHNFRLDEFKKMEKSLFDALAYFDPSDVEYKETTTQLIAVRDYIMYSPNLA